jgi:hypothetical protein
MAGYVFLATGLFTVWLVTSLYLHRLTDIHLLDRPSPGPAGDRREAGERSGGLSVRDGSTSNPTPPSSTHAGAIAEEC